MLFSSKLESNQLKNAIKKLYKTTRTLTSSHFLASLPSTSVQHSKQTRLDFFCYKRFFFYTSACIKKKTLVAKKVQPSLFRMLYRSAWQTRQEVGGS